MLRNERLEDITDGKKYGIDDMVRADAGGCIGCSKCCETMTDTIVLSPLDVFRLSKKTGKSFAELMSFGIELNMQDGIILPNLRNSGKGCVFLSEGRCSVHDMRPDFCRLFPLGRLYEGEDYSYILQTHECDKPRSKVKVRKWIDISDYNAYREFVLAWHRVVKSTRERFISLSMEGKDTEAKGLVIKLLEIFYQTPYESLSSQEEGAFYQEFMARHGRFKEETGI